MANLTNRGGATAFLSKPGHWIRTQLCLSSRDQVFCRICSQQIPKIILIDSTSRASLHLGAAQPNRSRSSASDGILSAAFTASRGFSTQRSDGISSPLSRLRQTCLVLGFIGSTLRLPFPDVRAQFSVRWRDRAPAVSLNSAASEVVERHSARHIRHSGSYLQSTDCSGTFTGCYNSTCRFQLFF